MEPYRPISALAVATLILGLVSIVAVLDWLLGVVPAVGIALGWLALRRIRRRPDLLAGGTLAKVGIGLAVAFWVLGAARLWYLGSTQAPPGYEPISYKMLEPDGSTPGELIPASAENLEDMKVFIKGYMYPGRQKYRLRHFILVRDNGVCGFCAPKPAPTDLIEIELVDGLETQYTTRLVGVGGKFRLNEDVPPGGVLYKVEADYIR
jgi:hypothetical protein